MMKLQLPTKTLKHFAKWFDTNLVLNTTRPNMTKPRLNLFITTLLMIVSVSGSAQAFDESESLDQKLATVKFEELQAQIIINKLRYRGRLDEEEAKIAKRAIASVKENAVEEIRKEALDNLQSSKSLATK